MRNHSSLQVYDPTGSVEIEWEWQQSQPMANSLAYICFRCGKAYAHLYTWTEDEPDPFSAVVGCCHTCPGDRWTIPGSVESYRLLGRELPKAFFDYQLDLELAFTESVNHPHYRKAFHD